MIYKVKVRDNVEVVTSMTDVKEAISEGFIPVDPVTWEKIDREVSYEEFAGGEVDFIREVSK